MKGIPSPRDALLLREGNTVFVTAVDSCGGIGSLSGDALAAPLELVGELTARTTLLEVLCVGAQPAFATIAVGSGPDAAEPLLRGVRKVLGGLPLAISTEKNVPTVMTALGITVMGACPGTELRIGNARKGDGLYCAGLPMVGAEVLQYGAAMPSPAEIQLLLETPGVRAALPVGSRGIEAEAQLLAQESGLAASLFADSGIDLQKSAGPSSCVLFAMAPEAAVPRLHAPVTLIGGLR